MIIDSHTHFGTILDFSLPEDLLIKSMDRYGIDAAVVSNVEGLEFDHDGRPVPERILQNQIEVNRKTIDFAGRHPGRINPLLWAMPHTGGAEQLDGLLAANLSKVHGIKLHPFLNNAAADSALVEPYLRLASKYRLPVVVHTAASDESSPARVARAAKKYPDVNFLMVHMGLYTDNREAIDLILQLPNLYGDTTWVDPERTRSLIGRGGIDKVLFGTDCPLGGADGYLDPIYRTYLKDWTKILSADDYQKLMSGNAIRFFHLPVSNDAIPRK